MSHLCHIYIAFISHLYPYNIYLHYIHYTFIHIFTLHTLHSFHHISHVTFTHEVLEGICGGLCFGLWWRDKDWPWWCDTWYVWLQVGIYLNNVWYEWLCDIWFNGSVWCRSVKCRWSWNECCWWEALYDSVGCLLWCWCSRYDIWRLWWLMCCGGCLCEGNLGVWCM